MAWSTSKVRLLFADDPIRLEKALGKPDIEARAREMAGIMRAEAGDLPHDEVQTWIKVAYAVGVKNVHKLAKGEGPGYYDPDNRAIYYNPHTDTFTACCLIIHETGHDLQMHRRIGASGGGLQRYDDNRRSVQHRACEVLEVVLMGKKKI